VVARLAQTEEAPRCVVALGVYVAIVFGLSQETVITLVDIAAVEPVHVFYFFDVRYFHNFNELCDRKVCVLMVNVA